MILTNKQLKKIIKEELILVLESSLDNRIQKQINKVVDNGWTIYVIKKGSYYYINIKDSDDSFQGHLKMSSDSCEGNKMYSIDMVRDMNNNIGPLLYDIALETLWDLEKAGLYTPRGSSLSGAAANVWTNYLKRSDVTVEQIPVEQIENCTPDVEAIGWTGKNVPEELHWAWDNGMLWGNLEWSEELWLHPSNIYSKYFYKKQKTVTEKLKKYIKTEGM